MLYFYEFSLFLSYFLYTVHVCINNNHDNNVNNNIILCLPWKIHSLNKPSVSRIYMGEKVNTRIN